MIQRHITWLTSLCRRCLRTVVASLALQSPGLSWCPELGRPLASAAPGLPSAHGPGTDGPRITRTVALLLQAPAQDSFVCSSTRQCWLQLWVLCTIVQRCCDCTASSASTTNVQTRLNWVTHNQDLLTRVWCQLKAVEHCLPR